MFVCRILIYKSLFTFRFGVDKSGLVSAAMSLLEAVEDNLYVDVFNVVKRIRRSRPKFIATLVRFYLLKYLPLCDCILTHKLNAIYIG